MIQSRKKRKIQVKAQSRSRLEIRQRSNFQRKALVLKKKAIYLRINSSKYNSLSSFLSALKVFQHENPRFLGLSNKIELKTLSYRFLKDIKSFKSGSNSVKSVDFLPQISKLFSSKIEKQKKEKMGNLRKKGLIFLKRLSPFPSFSEKNNSLQKGGNFKNFWFLKRKQFQLLKIQKRRNLSFKFRKPISSRKSVLNRRLLLHKIKTAGKKKYKKLHSFLFLKRNKLKSLFRYYIKGRRKFKSMLKYKGVRPSAKILKYSHKFFKLIQKHLILNKKFLHVDPFFRAIGAKKSIYSLKRNKLFLKNISKRSFRSITKRLKRSKTARRVKRSRKQVKLKKSKHGYFRSSQKTRRRRKKKMRRVVRLIKKWNRRKKWKRRGLFRLFRSKLRFFNFFSVPRHFEINYKTGEVLYLGFTDSSSVDLRLPFRLNIRRLTTYFSS